VGENIGAGYTTPADVVNGWMNSPGHRDNLLNSKYREIGVGHSTGGSWGNYWTMDLGAQPNVLPVFIDDDADESTSRQVTLTLTKEDVSSWGSLGPITGVQINEDSSFSGATWQSWSQTISFTLSPGNGTKTVYVKFTDGSNQVTSSDSIVLDEPVLILSVSPQSVTFLAQVGSGQTVPSAATLSISNTGDGILDWTAGGSETWLLLGSTGGTAPADVSVSVDNSGGVLDSLGTVAAMVTVAATSGDALNTPQTIPVTVHVVEEIHAIYLPMASVEWP